MGAREGFFFLGNGAHPHRNLEIADFNSMGTSNKGASRS